MWEMKESVVHTLENSLNQTEVRLTGIIHEETNLLNRVRQVGVDQHQPSGTEGH
jgi:hypothetical protein